MGKDAISENLIKTISDSLEAHELVKVSLLKTCAITANEAAVTISAETHSEMVQVIGRTFTLYRRARKINWGYNMRIAILGGAFDPIHKGHLQIAKVALKKLSIDEVWFMPSAETPLKPSQIACFQDRCAMIQAAIRPYRHMKLCTLEQELGGISYTIETVKYLQKQYPMHTFCWLIGDDQALQFDKWKASEELKKRIPFYVFSREKEESDCQMDFIRSSWIYSIFQQRNSKWS